MTNGYDADSRRTNLAILNASAATLASAAYGYDAASRLRTVGDGNGDVATYSYLANSPLVSQIAYAQGSTTRMTTTNQYDYLNRLTGISSAAASAATPAFAYSYNAANQRTKDKLVDGSYWVYGYDALGQVTGGHKYFYDGTGVPGQQFDYAFDTIGNRTQSKAGGDAAGGHQRVASYTVNVLNQLTARDYPGTNDVIGAALATNAVTVNGQAAWRKGEYFWSTIKTNNAASPAWLGAIVASGGVGSTGNVYLAQTPEQFSYDADGNLTNDGRWSYTWDAENRLASMTVNTNVGPQYQLTFAYDANGRRIQKVVAVSDGTEYVGQSTNNFVYDGWNLIGILNPASSLVESFTWGNDLSGSMQGAGGVGGLLAISYHGTATTNCFPAYDGNGNVAALVNAADGTLAANYEYGPFGEVIRATGPMAKANPCRFSTKYQDDESDLLYYGYRYYKPSTGTWLSRDPIDDLQDFDSFDGSESTYTESQFSGDELTDDILFDTQPDQVNPVVLDIDGLSTQFNLYRFIQNNPINLVDIFGLLSYTNLAGNYPTPQAYDKSALAKLIGGKVQQNIEGGVFQNTCSLRMSHALNKSGELIPKSRQTSSGTIHNKTKWWYIYRVKAMQTYLSKKHGTPEKYTSPVDFLTKTKCKKGIVIFLIQFSDATGHVDLWDGSKTIDNHNEYITRANSILFWPLDD